MLNCTVYWIDDAPAGRIGIMPRPRGGDWLEDEIRSLKAQDVDVLVSLLTPDEIAELDLTKEGDICESNGIEFVSFPIIDRDVPAMDRVLKALIHSLRDRLTNAKAIVIHCRGGIGRSGIMAACLMVSPNNPVELVMLLISHSRGCTVPDTNEQLEWVHRFAKWDSEDVL
jgi:protein-tyrosine phosphatase